VTAVRPSVPKKSCDHRVVADNDSAVPNLIEWAGGPQRIAAMINAFYDRVERDDLLGPLFPGGVSVAHRDHVAAWWSEVLGGPTRYSDDLGGYENMLAHHRNLAITGEQRLRFVTLMSRAADDASLPADPEFRAAIIGYLEWGTRIAVENSQLDSHPVPHAPVPRWGWGVAPPYIS
jgi:hemoglobin